LLRRGVSVALALGAILVTLLAGAHPAAAASDPTLITITGDSLAVPVNVRNENRPDVFRVLLKQLGWMRGASGTPMKIDQAKLGPKFTVTIAGVNGAEQVYDVYPLARGGPRAFRPAAQPAGKTSDAWFFLALGLPDVLGAAGVPLADAPAADPGVERMDTAQDSTSVNLHALTQQVRSALVTSVMTSVAALILLFGAARFSRARYRRRTSTSV
jgi:hypothetical protein